MGAGLPVIADDEFPEGILTADLCTTIFDSLGLTPPPEITLPPVDLLITTAVAEALDPSSVPLPDLGPAAAGYLEALTSICTPPPEPEAPPAAVKVVRKRPSFRKLSAPERLAVAALSRTAVSKKAFWKMCASVTPAQKARLVQLRRQATRHDYMVRNGLAKEHV